MISILPHVDRHIRELGFEGVRYVHVPNGIVVPEGEIPPAPEEIAVPVAGLRERGKFLLMYLGGFALANALDDLLDSAKELPEQIELVLIGGGPLKAEYERRVAEEGLSNVSILPAVRKTEVPAVLALADALYIGAKRSPLYRYGVGMNKIFDYMLAKKPILYGIESSNDPVAEAGCGITIPPEDAHAIAAGAAQLAALPEEERARMGENGFSYVLEHHDYRALAKRFAAAFEEDAS